MFFSLKNLFVSVENYSILQEISFSLEKGKTIVVFGPNGSGKSSLFKALFNLSGYKITKGKVFFEDKDITDFSTDEKTRLGLGLGFQYPPEIKGVKFKDLLKICAGKEALSKEAYELIEKLQLEKFLDREVNVNFSGGERKRAEILQLLLMKPKILFLDEPDSGVDIESLSLIGKEIENYLKKEGGSSLIITHQGYILEYIHADYALVLLNGKLHCFEKPMKILEDIRKRGYEGCLSCRERKKTWS